MPASRPDRHPAATTTVPAARNPTFRTTTPVTAPAPAAPRPAISTPSTSSSMTVTPPARQAPTSASRTRRLSTWWSSARSAPPRIPGANRGSDLRHSVAVSRRAVRPRDWLVGQQVVGGGPVRTVEGDHQRAAGQVVDRQPGRLLEGPGECRPRPRRGHVEGGEGLLAEVRLAHRGQHAGRRPAGPAPGPGVDQGDGHARGRRLPGHGQSDHAAPDHDDVRCVLVGHGPMLRAVPTGRRPAARALPGSRYRLEGVYNLRTTHGPTSSRVGRSTSLVGATR